jgi:hypothetical protein
MAASSDFAGWVTGLDFLQGLMKGAAQPMPGLAPWVTPTLDPEELDKRIGELRTVQYWLEQNAKLLGTTIQAMEVQRMTLATLRTMNVPADGVQAAWQARTATAPAPATGDAAAPAATAPVADPMQWWTALTQQFSQIAGQALQTAEPRAATAPGPATAGTTTVPRKRKAAATKSARRPSAKRAPRNAPRGG